MPSREELRRAELDSAHAIYAGTLTALRHTLAHVIDRAGGSCYRRAELRRVRSFRREDWF